MLTTSGPLLTQELPGRNEQVQVHEVGTHLHQIVMAQNLSQVNLVEASIPRPTQELPGRSEQEQILQVIKIGLISHLVRMAQNLWRLAVLVVPISGPLPTQVLPGRREQLMPTESGYQLPPAAMAQNLQQLPRLKPVVLLEDTSTPPPIQALIGQS